jgi:hypothetical protein
MDPTPRNGGSFEANDAHREGHDSFVAGNKLMTRGHNRKGRALVWPRKGFLMHAWYNPHALQSTITTQR